MNVPCSRPLLTASCLLLALGFTAATGSAQETTLRNFNSPGGLPVFGSSYSPPLMTRPLMAMLIDATRHAPSPGVLDKKIAETFGLGSGVIVMPLELVRADTAVDCAEHFFAVPLLAESNEVVIFTRQEDGSIEAFLSDASARLRAAAVLEADGTLQKVSRWKAAGRFMAELDLIGKEVRTGVKSYLRENNAPGGTTPAEDFNKRGAVVSD